MASDPSECNIKVVCRFRPQSDAENSCGGNNIVKFPSNETVLHMVIIQILFLFILGVQLICII